MEHLPPEIATPLNNRVASRADTRRTTVDPAALIADGVSRTPLLHVPAVGPWTAVAEVELRCPSAVAGGRLAAWLNQLCPFAGREPQYYDYLAPSRSRIAQVHRCSDLASSDVSLTLGLRFTTAARTLADLGRFVSDDDLERAGETALRTRRASELELRHLVARLGRPGCRGPAALLRFLRRRGPGTPPTESDLETRALQVIRRLGFPEPSARQLPIHMPGLAHPLRVDFAWQRGSVARGSARLILVEIDGRGTHANADALTHDLTRQNRIVGPGRVLLRFSADHVEFDPRHIAETLGNYLPTDPRRITEPGRGPAVAV